MAGAKIAQHLARDRWGRQTPDGRLSRDPQRTPMQWTQDENAGFCPPGIEPWLPIGDDTGSANAATQHADPGSMLNLTRRLLTLRATHPALRAGRFVLRRDVPDCILAHERRHADARILVAVNFTSAPATLPVGEAAGILATTALTGNCGSVRGRLRLSPDEAIVAQIRS